MGNYRQNKKSLPFSISETMIEWSEGGEDYIRKIVNDYMTFTKPISKQKSVCDFFVGKLSTHKIKNSNCTYSDYCYNIPLSFDIETSSWESNDEKYACMYVWQFGINGQCIFGRTWDEFLELYEVLTSYTTCQCQPSISDIINGTGDRLRFIIYVHKRGYEFQFIRKYFEWNTVFTDTTRKPIYALTESGLEFRDSLRLTGLSLEKSCENLTRYHVKKMVGDLDYKLLRGPKTTLTDKELGYIRHDVTGLNAIIKEKMEFEGNDLSQVPYTNTGYVRRDTRNKCYNRKYKNEYVKLMNELIIPDLECYNILKEGFAGGFTHASYLWVGRDIKGKIDSFDFTSSYPAVMLSEKYPMGKCTRIDCTSLTLTEIKTYIKNYACCFRITFKNLRKKSGVYDVYLSKNKCYNIKNGVFDNGRVWSADEISTTTTNVDMEVITRCYEFDGYKITDLLTWKWGYLPQPIIEATLDYYVGKTTLKGVSGKEDEYLMKKGMLNSEYGMMVMDILRMLITYKNNDWISEDGDYQQQLDKYNENKSHKRFTYYPWGLFVTAYARRNLWTSIIEFGDDYIYSDTDSIKCLNANKHMKYIIGYNQNITQKIDTVLKSYKINTELARPKTIKGKSKQLGVWDYETQGCPYTEFKTLGAKRYLVKQGDELHITVAGIPKRAGVKFLSKYKDPFKVFSDDMIIPEGESDKLIATYLDDGFETVIKDYLGIYQKIKEKSAINLKESSYKMSMSEEFKDFLDSVTVDREVL